MYKNVNLEKNYKINSCYHTLNPLIKILCFIMFAIITIIQNDIVFLGIISILLICLILMSDVDLTLFLSELNKLKFLFLIIFVINFLIKLDLITNLTVMLKILLLVFYYSLIIFTTSFDSLNYVFNFVLRPFKFLGNVINKISIFVTSAFMFIPNLILNKGDILEALSLRGLDYKSSNIVDKFKIIGIVLKSTFKYTFINSKNRKNALDIRSTNNNYVTYTHKKIGLDDLFILFTHVFVIVIVIIKGVM